MKEYSNSLQEEKSSLSGGLWGGDEDRAVRAFTTAIEKDHSENAETREMMFMAEWMVESGKTSEDWYNLPIADNKLIMAYLSVKHRRTKNIISMALGEVFGAKK